MTLETRVTQVRRWHIASRGRVDSPYLTVEAAKGASAITISSAFGDHEIMLPADSAFLDELSDALRAAFAFAEDATP